MRTHGFRSHILLVLVGAMTVIASLAMPWYARAPRPVPQGDVAIGDVNGPLNSFFHALQRWAIDASGATGWDRLGDAGQVLAALAGVSAVAALACTLPALQGVVREPLRYASLAALGLVAWKLVDPPGPNATWELRHGALVGAGGALMLALCAQGVASAPSRRRVVTPRYVAPPPPPAYEATRSAPPP
jgi:hypothetical protein